MARLSLGITHLQQQSYEFAIKNLKKAAEYLVDQVDAYYYLSIALLKGKRRKMHLVGHQGSDRTAGDRAESGGPGKGLLSVRGPDRRFLRPKEAALSPLVRRDV